MSDFTNDLWGWYVAVITVASILACALLLKSQSKGKPIVDGKAETMGHIWDGDLVEYNNPLPNWWRWLFYITIIFALVYLVLYPGLGKFGGVLNWTSTGQYDTEMARADDRFGPLYAKFSAMDIEAVAADPKAREMGQQLFLNNCSQCHASDARGSRGFPNLSDKDWLYGGDPQTIRTTIENGRHGIMPPMGAVLGGEGTKDVAHYVMSLSGMTYDNLRAARGKEAFATNCAACHGADGKGNPIIGAPNLTDDTWLYGRGETSIIETITAGRENVMPAWGGFLGNDKTHLLTAYVWALSNAN